MTSNKQEEQKEKSLSEELTQVLEEVATEDTEAVKPLKGEPVTILNETDLMIGEREYKLVADHREGFNAEKLGERFSDVLARYDYIVGDWGYEQLRLKGFFEADDRKALPEQRIDTLEDYLYEFCNFGCAYFVIKRIGGKREKTSNRRRRKRTGREDYDSQEAAFQASETGMEPGEKNSGQTSGNGQNRNSRDRRRSNRSNSQNNTRNKGGNADQKKRRNPQSEGQAHIEERREPLAKKRKPVIKSRQEKQPETAVNKSQPAASKGGKKGGYTIRKREE